MQVNIRHSYTQTLPNTYLEIGNGNNAYILRRVQREKSWHLLVLFLFEGSLEVKLPTIWTDDDRWKAEMGRVRQEKRREEERERARRKKIQVREKAGKSRNTVFFQWFVALEVRSLKRRVRSQLARWEIKNCTPLWREAHLQVKKLKAPPVRTTFGSCDVEKAHAFVARSIFPSQNVQNTPGSDHFWKLRCRKSARRCGAKHISKSKCTKHTSSGTLLEVEMSKKCTRLWREARFEVKSAKNWRVRSIFGRSDVLSRGRRKGLCTSSKVSKTWGFCSISKNDGRRGTFEEDLQRCIFRGRRSTRDMFIRAVRKSGRWFAERGCIFGADLQVGWDDFAWQVQRFVWPGITFSWQAQYFRQVEWKKRKTHWYEAVSSTLNFHFWRKVLQNCFVFDVVNFEKWGSLAALFRFWHCQVPKLRKSRRIAAFWCCQVQKLRKSRRIALFFKLADRQIDR